MAGRLLETPVLKRPGLVLEIELRQYFPWNQFDTILEGALGTEVHKERPS